MKILITTDLFSTSTNGVVTSVRNLCGELTRKGHEVRVLTLSDSVHSHRDGQVYYIRSIPIGFVYPDVRMPFSYWHPLIRELIDWRPDVVHSQCEFFSFQYARRISRLLGIPLIHTYHTLYEQYVSYLIPSKRLGRYVVRTISRRRLRPVDTVVAPTKKVEAALRGYGLCNPIRVIPSGISLAQHEKRLTEEKRREGRRRLGIPDDHRVILNLGRLGVEKNLEELLRIFAGALAHDDKLTFLIVGDGPARRRLEELAAELGAADHVIFTGMVSPAEVQDYYQLGDVFVSASTSETQGLTYVEAAANGLPLLCRRDPCLSGVIREGVNGYEYVLPEEFPGKLNAILSDESWRRAAGERSREIASAFGKDRFAAAIEAVYRSLLPAGGPAARS